MIKYTDSDKSLQIPRNLGNYPQSSVTGGTTPEEVQRMIDASLEDYDDEVIDPLKDTVNGKSTVEWDQQVTGGTKIAVVTIDGTPTDVYAPTSGGGGVTPEQVQQQIDESLVDYPTSAVTQDLDERVTELENASVDYATTADTQALETAISGKSTVDWNQIVTGGTKVAEITIDGTKTDVYAPTSGGGGVTPQDVQDAIDSALTPYSTTQQIETMLEDKQDTLTPGVGIQISGDTISTKRAVYDFTELHSMTATDLGTAMVEMRDRYADGWDVYIEVPVNATNATSASTVLVKLNAVKEIPASLTLNFEAGGPVGRWAVQLQRTTSTGQGAWTRTVGFNGAVTKAQENGSDYLPTATAGTKGGIYVGEGLTAPNGSLSVKPATANSIGGVIVGSGLTVDNNGVLSATGGGGASDYIVTGALSAITNPTEGQMATVEGGDVVKPLIEAYFTDYGSYDGSTFVSLYRSSDDGWMKDIWFDGSEFRDDINNDGNWQDYNWEGQDVRLRVIRDESDHSNDKVQIVNDGTVYMTPGSYVATGSTSITEFQPALNYIRTGNKWLQYGKVYDWNDIKENTSAETVALVAEIKMLAKTGVPVWVRMDGQVTYHGGIQCVLPYVTQSSGWVDFIGVGTQYGIGRYCHLYISDTKFDEDGFDAHGYRFDNNDVANLPSTSCVYIGPQGDFWGHRTADVLYQEELQPYLAVKGCLNDFSEEYGFGSIVYARKWIDQNDDTHYKFCLIVPTPNGPMRGVWETDDLGDVSAYTLVFWQPEYNHWAGSQQAYNALGTYDSGTIYYIDR